MKLLVWLGNPGPEYKNNRHNIGRIVLDTIAADFGIPTMTHEKKRKADICQHTRNNEKYVVVQPHTFMNLSGEAVQAVCQFFKILPTDILVIHDEIDVPVGTIQYKFGGGHAGHNGLKSIIAHLGTNEFYRMRIGVDRPIHKNDVSDYVLSNIPSQEKEKILSQIKTIEMYVEEFLHGKKK